MPNMDGTGPRGRGPFTGRGFGHCRRRNIKSNTEKPLN